MQRHLQPAVDRFRAISEDYTRQAVRDRLGAYVRIYAFLSQIIPYADSELEISTALHASSYRTCRSHTIQPWSK